MRDCDELEEALVRIRNWAQEAYPTEVFPEPDMKQVRSALEAAGVSLGAVSAHILRHALAGVGKIAQEALGKNSDEFLNGNKEIE